MRTLHTVVPDSVHDPSRPSGGNTYDRRLTAGLVSLGWTVSEHQVPGIWPEPDDASRRAFAAETARLPDDGLVLVDGLLASNSPETLVRLAQRLDLVVLVHLPLENAPEREALAAADAVIATSAWTRRRLLAVHHLDPGRVHVAQPGVDSAPLSPGTPAGGELLCVGAVTPVKGHDLLVAALAMVGEMPWRCRCAGSLTADSDYVEHVTRQAREAGIATRLELLGPLDRIGLEQAYAAADLLVVPSRVETYGMVVTEALAHGIPVLGAAVGGLPEALDGAGAEERPGLLVPADDSEALAVVLRAWLTDVDLRERLRRSARERRASLRPWSRTAHEVSAVLDALTAC